jgi:hypothetical protein
MTPQTFVALALADTFLAREASVEAMQQGARRALGKKWRWIPSLCRAVYKQFGDRLHRHGRTELAALILAHQGFADAWLDSEPPQIRHFCLDLPLPAGKPAWVSALPLPALATTADLASGSRQGRPSWTGSPTNGALVRRRRQPCSITTIAG